ncbi:MAG: cytochrome b/b6 domain-containing protein [Rhodospirillaceae bacterium]
MTIKDHEEPGGSPVWDLPTRLYHWLQLALVVLALLTGFLVPADWLNVHVVLGALIAALLAFRLVWGVFGPEHSRFASFPCPPRRVAEHLGALLRRRPSRHFGHTPAGGAMVVALMAALATLIASGYIRLGGVFKEGPLATLFSYAAGARAGDLHSLLAYGLIGLIAVHVLGVWLESRLLGENLIRAMISGVKRDTGGAPAAAGAKPRKARPMMAGAVLLGIVYLVCLGLIWSLRQPPAVPRLPANPLYTAECGGCHWAYHPSLLPADSWSRLVAGLAGHFGEDASLPPERAAAIAGWLTSHSAETWDTLPANRLRTVDAAEPLRITATPFWKRQHSHIPAAVFKSFSGGAGACTACHTDAESGRFSIRRIDRSHRLNLKPPPDAKGTP